MRINEEEEGLLKQIVINTGLPRQEILKLMKERKDRLSGNLSNIGALFLISKELGIDLDFSKKFIVNKHIMVKLEEDKTNIYIKGELFRQCKYLLLNVQIDDIRSLDEIKSIDELVDKYGERSEETFHNMKYKLSAEEEFVGHCSNMQMFAESGYDTKYLRANLAFPLLKKLSEVGDPKANKVFKEEIAKRLEDPNINVFLFLLEEGYLDVFNKEQLEEVVSDLNNKDFSNRLLKILLKSLESNEVNYAIIDFFVRFNYIFIDIIIEKIKELVDEDNIHDFANLVKLGFFENLKDDHYDLLIKKIGSGFLDFLVKAAKKLFLTREDENIYDIIIMFINGMFRGTTKSLSKDKAISLLNQLMLLQRNLTSLEHDYFRGVNYSLYILYDFLEEIKYSLRQVLKK